MPRPPLPHAAASLPWSLLAPAPALALGMAVMHLSGAPPSRWAINAACWAAGAALAWGLGRASPAGLARAAPALGAAALALLLLSLAGPAMDGVRRWVQAGPVRLHAGALSGPLLLWGAAAGGRPGRLAALAAQALCVAQPDAGQATAQGAGLLVIAASERRWGLGAAAAALAALAWLRPDPLPSVDDVEGIVRLAWALGPGFGLAAVASLLALLAPFAAARSALGAALGAYVAGSIAASAAGNFPVPLLGLGASPVLGFHLALGLLAAGARAPGPGAQRPSASRTG